MLVSEPQDEFLNYALAIELEHEGQLTEATTILQALLKRNPAYLAGYYKLGELLSKAALKEEAVIAYQQGMALAKQQKNPKTFQELRQALENLEEED